MAMAEDAASVLEQFVQDVANIPAEIAHLLEEVHAKDRIFQECRNIIANRDNNIQKFVKTNGAGQPNPKDDVYTKVITANFDRAQAVQEEKVALSEKAALLLDRQIKRLDFKIRDLQNEGAIQPDPQLPSLLSNTSLSTRFPALSTTTTGTNTPLNPLSGNAGPSTTMANPPINRLVQPASQRQPSPLTSLPSNSIGRTSARSPSTDPSKRRRINPLPPTSSSLRQSSLGPGTPKTPIDGTPRGSTTGPRPVKKGLSSRPTAPHQRVNHLNPIAAKKPTPSSLSSRRRTGNKSNKSSTPASNDPSESAEDVEMEDAEGEEEDEGQDDRKYCTCRSVSYGNMVGCDNEECPFEWFHWSCVGLKSEPPGKWYCPTCRKTTKDGRLWDDKEKK